MSCFAGQDEKLRMSCMNINRREKTNFHKFLINKNVIHVIIMVV